MRNSRCFPTQYILSAGQSRFCPLKTLANSAQCRHYARKRSSPSFNPGRSAETSLSGYKGDDKDSESDSNKDVSRFRRWLSPGKVIFLSICSLIGYKIYKWQTDPHRSTVLNPKFFTPFILESKETVSPTSSVFNLLSVPSGQNVDNISEAWRAGVWSVQVMQPDLQIQRPYTPLPPTRGIPNELLRLYVRKEASGEVSSFLHRLPLGTLVHMRGPYLEYQIPEDVEEVLFLAGGTGIAPALQVAHCLFNLRKWDGKKTPRMKILWANRRREDSRAGLEPEKIQEFRQGLWVKARNAITTGEASPRKQIRSISTSYTAPSVQQTRLVEEVEQLVKNLDGRLSIDYFVDEEGTHITKPLLTSYLRDKSSSTEVSYKGRDSGKKLLLISGPDGFVAYYAGSNEWQSGKRVAGPLGGILKEINPQGWDIWTL